METIMYVRLVCLSTVRTPHARHHAKQKTSANADLHSIPHVHMGIHRHAWIAEQRIDMYPHSHVLHVPHDRKTHPHATQKPSNTTKRGAPGRAG